MKVIRDRNFITRAREQLDADHYGLDKVKRRLIEYLAVLRLHQLAADAELKAEKEEEAKREAETVEQSKALVVRPKDDQNMEAPLIPAPQEKIPRKRSRNAVKGPILLYAISFNAH